MRTRIDSKGYWIQNYSDTHIEKYYNPSDNWIFANNVYDTNLQYVKPRLFDGVWIEEATQEDVQADKEPRYKDKIENAFNYLYTRALASSMNKSNLNREFLQAQREVYQDKYDIAIGNITSGVKYDNTLELINGEMEDEFSEDVLDVILPTFGVTPTGTHLNKMFQLIIFKFEFGYNSFSAFKKFLERFRTKCFTWSDLGYWDKIDSGLNLVYSMPSNLSLQEAEGLYNQFNLI